jgi:wyosine [tRNA(Phe)-imidazoG37] synthetase (radical SAM superfamily)
MANILPQGFSSMYGPVASWRYGRSLGIDPIGPFSTCSFDCVYCQLGGIEDRTRERRIFVPTSRILQELRSFAVDGVDVITLSGSGEPTLALNLGEVVSMAREVAGKPVGVLTNASLLGDTAVRHDLARADFVAAKLDAASDRRFRRVNRPAGELALAGIRRGLLAFRREYHGRLAVQTMLLGRWPETEQAEYIAFIGELSPDEIQLCVPSRPRPRVHQLDARGRRAGERPAYAARRLRSVDWCVLRDFVARLRRQTRVAVRFPPTEGARDAESSDSDLRGGRP